MQWAGHIVLAPKNRATSTRCVYGRAYGKPQNRPEINVLSIFGKIQITTSQILWPMENFNEGESKVLIINAQLPEMDKPKK